MDLHHLVDEIDDPALRDPGPGIEAGFVPVVDAIRAIRHFDDQHGARRVPVQIRAGVAGDDRHVGLGLRVVVKRDGKLRVELPLRPEHLTQRLMQQMRRRVMGPDRGPARVIDFELQRGADLQRALLHRADMHEKIARLLLHVGDAELDALARQHAGIADLAA